MEMQCEYPLEWEDSFYSCSLDRNEMLEMHSSFTSSIDSPIVYS